MAQEIERKFLVTGDFRGEAGKATRIIQGYLSSVPERTVRIRIRGEKGFITIKGPGNATGVIRYEWEKEIPVTEAEELLTICEPGVIDKTRYEIIKGNHVFEVDEFYGENTGLILAEIELSSEDEVFERPHWLGDEVTGDSRYFNSELIRYPFSKWQEQG
jgi:adenylate cyclase